MRENPVKRPIMPPTLEILSEKDIRALLVIYTGIIDLLSLCLKLTLVMMKSFDS